MSQLQRLMEIDRLIRAGKAPTPDSLAKQLGVTTRQIFLDRKRLMGDLGAPLVFDRQRKGWVYTDATWVLPTAILTEGELLAFFLSIDLARSASNAGLHESLASAVAKIARGLGDVVSVDLSALRESLSFAAPPAAPINAHTATQLAQAQTNRRKVSMLYDSRSSELKWRVVHPYHLYLTRGEWLLLAWDETHDAVRRFNIARIKQLQIRKQPFERSATFDVESHLRSSLWAEAGNRVFDIAIAFDAYQARFMRERTWHPNQKFEELEDGGIVLRFPASGLKEVARFVMGYGCHARVLAPPELIEIVKEHVSRMNQMYKEVDQ